MKTVTQKKFQYEYFSFGSKEAPLEVLQFKGFFEPIIKVEDDLPANLYGIPANIEEIIMQTYSGYSLDNVRNIPPVFNWWLKANALSTCGMFLSMLKNHLSCGG